MSPSLMLGLQVGFAAFALLALVRNVYPALGHSRHGELAVDVWLPIALVIPLLFLVGGVDGSVREAGWPALAGPVICGVMALALASMIGREGIGTYGEEFVEGEAIGWRLTPRLTVVALLAGLILLLLGAAHVMSLWVGQSAFAIGAILLWINTPEIGRRSAADGPWQVRAGFGMLLVLISAFAQGFVGRLAGEEMRWLVVLLMLGYAAGALACAARQTSAGLCVRLGVWSASFGVFFALGLIALLAMVPRILATVWGVELPPHSMDIAAGFGVFALEATMLMLLPPVAMAVMRLPRAAQPVIGAAVLVLIALRVLWWLGW